ncbi:MAG TPA: HEPN domain-containing protein [Bryobacteraceae bacterium]|jgi:hypothetical protein
MYADSKRVQAHTRAFLVLSHAEIESYLESWAKEITRSCESVWKAANRVTKPLAFLLVSISERIEAGQTLSETKGKDVPTRLEESARRLFEKHYTQVKNNHGIKEKNFWSLLGPLGVPVTALPSTLLPNLDSLGEIRGQHAHQSIKAVASVLDPETEYKRVSDLVDELKTFDEWIAKYKHAIR